MDGGHTSDAQPTSLISFVDILCRSTKAVTARNNHEHCQDFYNAIHLDVQDIPNQPIIFSADPKKKHRSEDAMIAYTWAHFINDTKSPYWLARLPMTKAGVRAMYAKDCFSLLWEDKLMTRVKLGTPFKTSLRT